MPNLASLYKNHLTEQLQRHRELMCQHKIDYLVIPSGEAIPIYLDDMNYPFRSSFMFRSYLPLTELANSYLILGLEGEPELIYYQPIDYWHSTPEDPAGIWAESLILM